MTRANIYIHPSSFVDEGVIIGNGTSIWHFSHIFKGARLGENCKIGQNVVIHPSVVLGNNVKIQNNVSLYDGVVLEDDVFCGPSCVFTNILNPRSAYPRNSPEFYKKTTVKRGASIGANATIICGVTVGRHALIGAGAVVTKDVGDYELIYGNPARVRGHVCECGEKLLFSSDTSICSACQKTYKKSDDRINRLS